MKLTPGPRRETPDENTLSIDEARALHKQMIEIAPSKAWLLIFGPNGWDVAYTEGASVIRADMYKKAVA